MNRIVNDRITMRRSILLLLMMVTLADATTRKREEIIFYVSSRGSDAYDGRHKGSPFATLEAARDAIRHIKKAGDGKTTFRVRIEGTLQLSKTFVLEPQDSGTPEAPIIYEGVFPSNRSQSPQSVLSGGTLVDLGVKRTPDASFVVEADHDIGQLYGPGCRTRFPFEGYLTIDEAVAPTGRFGTRPDRFRYKKEDEKYAVAGAEIVILHTWTTSRLRIESVDRSERIITFTGATCTDQPWSSLAKGIRYFYENINLDDDPRNLKNPLNASWRFDAKTSTIYYKGKLSYYLPTQFIVPKIETLVELRGDVNKKEYVSNILFKSISFRYTAWHLPKEGYSFPQAEIALPSAVSAKGSRNCNFQFCDFRNTGAWAVELGAGCKNTLINECDFYNMGAGAVKIGSITISDDDDAVASHNSIYACRIGGGGRIHAAAIGIWIGQSHDNKIISNTIDDFYYTAISVGWTWGYGKSLAYNNIIEENRISKIGQGVLSDMGGIYTLGVSPGTVLRKNTISNIESYQYGGWGIYFDEGSTGILAEHNIVYNTKSAGFHQHYGKENIVRNNIFAFGREAQIMRTRAEDHKSFTFEKNIVVYDDAPLLGSNFDGNNYSFDSNIYWNRLGKPVLFKKLTLDEWQSKGQDKNSIVADPMFRDPDKGEFTFRAGSPASKLGFDITRR
ncbi:MAG: right-handed parallel beta-helix repeat-containing protein [Planctomycetota bacterium]